MNKYHNPYNTILELTGAKKVKQRINKTIKKKAAIKKNSAKARVSPTAKIYKESWKDKIIRKLKKLLKKRIKKSNPNMHTLIPETVDLIEMSKNKKSGNNNEVVEVVELWDVEEEEKEDVERDAHTSEMEEPIRTKEEEDKVPDMQIKKTMKEFSDISQEELKEFKEANKTKDKAKIMELFSKHLNKLIKDKDFKFKIDNWVYQQGMNFADTEEGRINQLLGIPKFWEAHIEDLKKATKERKNEVQKLKHQIKKLENGPQSAAEPLPLTEEDKKKLTDLKSKLVNEKRHIDENKIILYKHENAEYLRDLFKDKLKGEEKPLNYYIHSAAGLKGVNTRLRNKVEKISKHVKEKFNLWLDDLKKPLKDIAEKLKLSKSAELIHDKLEKNQKIQTEEEKNDEFLKSISKSAELISSSWWKYLTLNQKEEKQIQKEVKNDMVEIEKIKTDYEEMMADLNRKLEVKNTVIINKDILINEKNRFIDNLEKIKADNEWTNNKLNNEISYLNTEITNLWWTESTQLNELNNELNRIKTDLTKKENSLNQLETEFKNYEKWVAERKIQELKKNNDKKILKDLFKVLIINKTKALGEKVNQKYAEKDAELLTAGNDLKDLKEKYELSQQEIKQVKEESAKITGAATNNTTISENLSKLVDEKEAEIKKLRTEFNAQKTLLETAQQTLKTKTDEFAQIKTQNEEFARTKIDMELGASATLETLDMERLNAKTKIEKLKKKRLEEYQTYENNVASLNYQIHELNEDLIKLQSIKNPHVDFKDDIIKLESEKAQIVSELDELKQKYELLDTEHKILKDPNNETMWSTFTSWISKTKSNFELFDKFKQMLNDKIRAEFDEQLNSKLENEIWKAVDGYMEQLKKLDLENAELKQKLKDFYNNPQTPQWIKKKLEKLGYTTPEVSQFSPEQKPKPLEEKIPEKPRKSKKQLKTDSKSFSGEKPKPLDTIEPKEKTTKTPEKTPKTPLNKLQELTRKEPQEEKPQEEEQKRDEPEPQEQSKTNISTEKTSKIYDSPTKEDLEKDYIKITPETVLLIEEPTKFNEETFKGYFSKALGGDLTDYLDAKYKNLPFLTENNIGYTPKPNKAGKVFKISKKIDTLIKMKENEFYDNDLNILKIDNEKALNLGILFYDLYLNYDKEYINSKINKQDKNHFLKISDKMFDIHFKNLKNNKELLKLRIMKINDFEMNKKTEKQLEEMIKKKNEIKEKEPWILEKKTEEKTQEKMQEDLDKFKTMFSFNSNLSKISKDFMEKKSQEKPKEKEKQREEELQKQKEIPQEKQEEPQEEQKRDEPLGTKIEENEKFIIYEIDNPENLPKLGMGLSDEALLKGSLTNKKNPENPPTAKEVTDYLTNKYKNLVIDTDTFSNKYTIIKDSLLKVKKGFSNDLLNKYPVDEKTGEFKIQGENPLTLGILYYDISNNYRKMEPFLKKVTQMEQIDYLNSAVKCFQFYFGTDNNSKMIKLTRRMDHKTNQEEINQKINKKTGPVELKKTGPPKPTIQKKR